MGVERQTLTDKPMRAFEVRHLQRHEFHGNWDYTVREVQDQADQHTPRPTTRPDSPNNLRVSPSAVVRAGCPGRG